MTRSDLIPFRIVRKAISNAVATATTTFAVSLFAFAVVAAGQTTRYPSAKGRPFPPPVDASAVQLASRGVAESRGRLARAEQEMSVVVAEIRSEAEARPDWRAADDVLRRAQFEYEDGRRAALSVLESSERYQAALAAKEGLARHLAQDRAAGEDADHLKVTATDKMTAGAAVSAMHASAIAADPRMPALRSAMNDAAYKVAALRADFDAALRADYRWQEARAAIDAARSAVAAAEEELAKAADKQVQAERQRQQQVAEIERERAAQVARGRRRSHRPGHVRVVPRR